MNTAKNNVIFAAAVSDCAVLSRPISVTRSVFQDAEKWSAGEYSVLTENGRIVGDSIRVYLNCPVLPMADPIRVEGANCTLYRIVKEKVYGFAAVVCRKWQFVKHRLQSHLRRKRILPRLPVRWNAVLSLAGGLRL